MIKNIQDTVDNQKSIRKLEKMKKIHKRSYQRTWRQSNRIWNGKARKTSNQWSKNVKNVQRKYYATTQKRIL